MATDHGEPPIFVKWLIWLLRKDTWKEHPFLAPIGAVIVVFIGLGAVYGMFYTVHTMMSAPATDEQPVEGGHGTLPPPATLLPLPPIYDSDVAKAVSLGKDDCPPSRTDSVPNVTLQTGDLVVLGNGELVRLDNQMRPTTIASDGFLAEARGVAVDRNGQIFVTAMACTERRGAVVRVDPLSGTQTPVVYVFKRSMGLAFESDGQLLVGDEVAKRGVWGRLHRVNLTNRTSEVIAEFPPTNGVHSIAIYPGSLDIYVADGVVQRIDRQNPTSPMRVEVDDLQSAQALAILSSGEIFIGDHNGAALFQIMRGSRKPLKIVDNGAFRTFWSLAISIDEKSLFVSSGARLGSVYQLNLPLDDKPPILVWKSTRSGTGMVFVTVVKLEQ